LQPTHNDKQHLNIDTLESKDLYIVELSIPWNQPMLGGGFGFYHIDKHTMKIIKVMFYK
jgi:hypothetical protein